MQPGCLAVFITLIVIESKGHPKILSFPEDENEWSPKWLVYTSPSCLLECSWKCGYQGVQSAKQLTLTPCHDQTTKFSLAPLRKGAYAIWGVSVCLCVQPANFNRIWTVTFFKVL